MTKSKPQDAIATGEVVSSGARLTFNKRSVEPYLTGRLRWKRYEVPGGYAARADLQQEWLQPDGSTVWREVPGLK